jgi:ABC-type transport system involved in Fe-S cluster assembly fused permease/ATPase subunit
MSTKYVNQTDHLLPLIKTGATSDLLIPVIMFVCECICTSYTRIVYVYVYVYVYLVFRVLSSRCSSAQAFAPSSSFAMHYRSAAIYSIAASLSPAFSAIAIYTVIHNWAINVLSLSPLLRLLCYS